jgi:hypothetical protein
MRGFGLDGGLDSPRRISVIEQYCSAATKIYDQFVFSNKRLQSTMPRLKQPYRRKHISSFLRIRKWLKRDWQSSTPGLNLCVELKPFSSPLFLISVSSIREMKTDCSCQDERNGIRTFIIWHARFGNKMEASTGANGSMRFKSYCDFFA